MGLRYRHEFSNHVSRMLPVCIQGEDMCVARCSSLLQAMQHGRAFALVAWQNENFQRRSMLCEGLQCLCRAIRTAIHHHPHRLPNGQRVTHRFEHFSAGVIGRNKHEVGIRKGRQDIPVQFFVSLLLGSKMFAEIIFQIFDK